MNEPTSRRSIIVGLLPSGGSMTRVPPGQEDPVEIAIRQAHAELDRQRATEERARRAKLADVARAQNTRRARAARRFKRALKVFARLK